ncbi:hypothetical protein, partial [Halobacteriovorax sp. HFRX-2_2]|uniref:hypothetical protein n=2 Tax=unclassified Halobacteriovorax TaxID=2639665 RepID=UPI0037198290
TVRLKGRLMGMPFFFFKCDYTYPMNEFLMFTLRYTPFWSIPIMIIGGRFAYYYWLRGYTLPPIFFAFCSAISSFFLFIWIMAGGPDKVVHYFLDIVRNF